MLIELEKAKTRNNLVRIFREGLDGTDSWYDGFVLEANEEMVLLQLIDDSIRLNGYQILFLEDISDFVHPSPFNDFQKRVLELRQETIQLPRVELTELGQLLLDITEKYGLITLHREEQEADSCEIGRVLKIDDVSFELEEIGSDARWFDDTYEYDLYDITRIEFGGAYEEALLLVNEDLGDDAYELDDTYELDDEADDK